MNNALHDIILPGAPVRLDEIRTVQGWHLLIHSWRGPEYYITYNLTLFLSLIFLG